MAMFREGTIFVILLIKDIHIILTQDPELAFGYRGGVVWFEVHFTYRLSNKNFTSLLYRYSEDGVVLLMNSSDPSDRHSGSLLATRVGYDSHFPRFWLRNLSELDNGHYLTQRWRNGILRDSRVHDLIVCGNPLNLTVKKDNKGVVENLNIEQGDRLLVYKELNIDTKTLILNTSLSLPGKQDNVSTEAKVFRNGSTISITGIGFLYDDFHFLIWSGDHCQSYGKTTSPTGGTGGGTMLRPYLLKVGERVTLYCHPDVEHVEVFSWETPLKDIYTDRSLSANLTRAEEEEMHVEPGGDKLIIPSVSEKHSGDYSCRSNRHVIIICSDLEALHLTFSPGGSVVLDCVSKLNIATASCECFHQRGVIPYDLPSESEETQGREELVGERVNYVKSGINSNENANFSLTLSNLTLNDSGRYRCRSWVPAKGKPYFCFDRNFHLTEKDPFGIDSTFYRVYSYLMACGLLGMICAVISVHLRIQRGDQASQGRLRRTAEPSDHPAREAQQSEPADEDDVNSAEDFVVVCYDNANTAENIV